MKQIFKGFLGGLGAAAITLLCLSASNRSDFESGRSLETFFNIFRDVNLMYVDTLNSSKMISTAANAMLEELDPYTEYMPKEEYEQFSVATSGKYGGMGALIRKTKDQDYVEVSEIFEGFGAHKAGLVAGDLLMKIDGKPLKNSSSSDVSNMLKGDPNSTFKLTIKSWLTDSIKVVDVKRELVKINPVTYYGIVDTEKGVGYICLTTFSENCGREVEKAIEDMKNGGNLKSLIIDLRDNGGGILDEAVKIVGMFVDKGTEVVSMKGRLYKEAKVYRTPYKPLDKDIPLLVMVNGNSASASEIVAGALQDLDRAVIMGTKTFGKGLVQTTRQVGEGGVLKVTTAKYYIPSGRCIQKVDFSSRDKDGQATVVADSLRNAFKTKGGRVVYDGGGISPDIEAKNSDKWTQFTAQIAMAGYDSDFANLFFKKNQKNTPNIETFKLSDQELANFASFLKEKKFKPTSSSEYHLKKLKASAKEDRYSGIVAENIDKIEKAIKMDISEEVQLNHDHLISLIEKNIITAFHHQSGKAEYVIKHDKLIKEAAQKVGNYRLIEVAK